MDGRVLEQELVAPLVGLLEEVPAVQPGLTPVGVHPSPPASSGKVTMRATATAIDPVWSKRSGHRETGPGRIVRVRHRLLQVARAGELDIDVAVIGGGRVSM